MTDIGYVTKVQRYQRVKKQLLCSRWSCVNHNAACRKMLFCTTTMVIKTLASGKCLYTNMEMSVKQPSLLEAMEEKKEQRELETEDTAQQ